MRSANVKYYRSSTCCAPGIAVTRGALFRYLTRRRRWWWWGDKNIIYSSRCVRCVQKQNKSTGRTFYGRTRAKYHVCGTANRLPFFFFFFCVIRNFRNVVIRIKHYRSGGKSASFETRAAVKVLHNFHRFHAAGR